MAECYRAMMGVPFLNQHMTVKPPHFMDGKYAYSAKRTGFHWQYFPLGNISPQFSFTVALQAAISPSYVPRVKSGSESFGSSRRCWMSWYFTARSAHILQLGVLPQWKPINVSVRV